MDRQANALDEVSVSELAAAARVDRRSIRKALRGERVRGLAGARIERAIEAYRAGKEGAS